MGKKRSERMFVKVIRVDGVDEALLGLGLSHGLTAGVDIAAFRRSSELYERMTNVARKLAHRGNGHSKFLESVQLWLDVTAPRYWWSEMDTYRAGVTKQSESTMHTLLKKELGQENFEYPVPDAVLARLNAMIVGRSSVERVKNELPEGFLQRRIISMNAKSTQHVIRQRRGHKLRCWEVFIQGVLEGWQAFGLPTEVLEDRRAFDE
jgi:hypothetical protein